MSSKSFLLIEKRSAKIAIIKIKNERIKMIADKIKDCTCPCLKPLAKKKRNLKAGIKPKTKRIEAIKEKNRNGLYIIKKRIVFFACLKI